MRLVAGKAIDHGKQMANDVTRLALHLCQKEKIRQATYRGMNTYRYEKQFPTEGQPNKDAVNA